MTKQISKSSSQSKHTYVSPYVAYESEAHRVCSYCFVDVAVQ